MLVVFVTALLLAPTADLPVITPRAGQGPRRPGGRGPGRGGAGRCIRTEPHPFLNFGWRYPNHVFTAVILERNLHYFPDARSWEGKTIKVRGQVRLYKGKPEIILERPDQVTVPK